jgi:hypothetical protein
LNGKLKIDRYVLANDQALIGETLPETGHRKWHAIQPKHPNHRQPHAPLRTCDTGPSCRAAEPSDEFAPSKTNAHLHLPRLLRTGSRLQGEDLSPTRYLIIMG